MIKKTFYDTLNKHSDLLNYPHDSAAILTKKSLFIIEKKESVNGFGNGEIISITGFREDRLKESTQFNKFKEAVLQAKNLGLRITGLPRMLITIKYDDNKVEITTDEEIVYYTVSNNFWNMLWLPETFVDWKDTSQYDYKKKFNYWFTIFKGQNEMIKGKIFVNRGIIIKDISITKNSYSYNVRGWTGQDKNKRSEYVTLVRIDGAHGFYHIHFGEKKDGGTVVLPSYDVKNIEIRVSESKLKYLERKLKKLKEKGSGLKIVDKY